MLDLEYDFKGSRNLVILIALRTIATIFLCLTINSAFYSQKCIYYIVNIFAACLIMSPLVYFDFKFKNEDILYLIVIIQMYLYFCISAYIFCDTIERMSEHYKSLTMFISWFIVLCFFVYIIVKIFLQDSKFFTLSLSAFIILLGFLNESNWTIVALVIACIVFLLKFENLQILCKRIFDIKIEDSNSNKYKLIVIHIMTIVFEAMLCLSLKLSEYLSELLNWIYDCANISDSSKLLNNEIITKHMWLGFYSFIILAVILVISFAVFNCKKDTISSYIKNIFYCEDTTQDQKNQEMIDKVYASKHNLDNKDNGLAKAKKSFKGAYDDFVAALAEFNARYAAWQAAQAAYDAFETSGVNDSAKEQRLADAVDRAAAHWERANTAYGEAETKYNDTKAAALAAKAVYEAALQAYKDAFNAAVALGVNPALLPPVKTADPLDESFNPVPGAKELYAEALSGKFGKAAQADAKKAQKEIKKRAKLRRKPARMVLKLVQERKSNETRM